MAKRTSRKRWFWITGGLVLIIAGLLVGGLGLFGLLPWQKSGDLYEDPQRRFTMEVGPSWERVETGGSFAQFKIPDPAMNVYLLVLEAGTVEDAFSEAINVLGFDAGLLSGGLFANFDDWLAYTKVDAAEIDHGLVGQIVGGNAFIVVVKADKPGMPVANAPVFQALARSTLRSTPTSR